MSFTSETLSAIPGAIASVTLENAGATTLAGGFTTLGQTFAPGELPAGGSLSALIGSATVPVQVDVKTTWPDGSAKMVVLTLERPDLAAGAEIPVTLVSGTAPQGAALDMMQKLAGHSFDVMLTPLDQPAIQIDVLHALQDALKAGTASFWQQGPLATQARVEIDVPNSSQRLVFDVTVFADGQFKVDAQFNNDRAMELVGGRVQYGVSINMDGHQVANETLDQGQYQNWHVAFSSDPTNGGQGLGDPSAGWLNIVQDVAKLGVLGVVPDYDLSLQVPESLLNTFTQAVSDPSWGDPLASNYVTQYMPMTGGRGDIGFVTQGNAAWLISGDARAAEFALGQAEAASSVPWHFYDEANATWVNTDNYPRLWTDGRAYAGTPGDPASAGLTQQMDGNTGWTPDVAHQPSLSFVPYVLTGERWMLDNLQAQASASVISAWAPMRSEDGNLIVQGAQVRASAWGLRELEDAAWASPEGSAERAYFRAAADANWSWIASKIPEWTVQQGEAYGRLPGTYGWSTVTPPWQQDYFASTAILAASRGNADATAYLNWAKNFLIGRFEHAEQGFNPRDGVAYVVVTTDGASGQPLATWADMGSQQSAAGLSNGSGWSRSDGDYAQLALATLAAIYKFDGDVRALNAYNWLLSQNPPYTSPADFAASGTSFAVLLSDSTPTDTHNGGSDTPVEPDPGTPDTGTQEPGTPDTGTQEPGTPAPNTSPDDTLTLNAPVNSGTVDLGDGFDTLRLADGDNAVEVRNVEALAGGSGDDVVTLGNAPGEMTIDLGGGNDVLNLPATGDNLVMVRNVETINGGAGIDAVYLARDVAANVVVSGIERLVGSALNDVVTVRTAIQGGSVDLGDGNDTLKLADGGNTLEVSGVETLTGGAGDDVITLGNAPEAMFIDLGGGNDLLQLPSTGDSTVTVRNVESIEGGAGSDTVYLASDLAASISVSGIERLVGSAFDDVVTVQSAIENGDFDLGAGTDTLILAAAGANSITVRNAEVIQGGMGNDDVTLGTVAVNTRVSLGGGNDRLTLSSAGANTLTVSGVETVIGGSLNDSVTLGAVTKNALLDLGAGFDTVILSSAGANIVTLSNVEKVLGGTVNDQITLATPDLLGLRTLAAGATSPLSIVLDTASSVSGSAADETVTFTKGLSGAVIDLGDGQDTLDLSSAARNSVETRGVEAIFGGSAADTVTVTAVTASPITVDLMGGSDKLVLSTSAVSSLKVMAANVETIIGGSAAETVVLTTRAAGTVVDLGGGQDRLELGNFNNVIQVANVETVIGNAGADRITVTAGSGAWLDGAAGKDTLIGGAGNDTIIGGAGVDTMTGGAGADQFLFLAASDSRMSALDRITDFNASQDSLAFDDLLSGSFAFRGTAGFTGSGNTEARYASGSRVLQLDFNGDGKTDFAVQLDNVSMSSLTAHNFVWL